MTCPAYHSWEKRLLKIAYVGHIFRVGLVALWPGGQTLESSKLYTQSVNSSGELSMHEAWQAGDYERQIEILAQQHQLLLNERDQLYLAMLQLARTDAMLGLPNHEAAISRLDDEIAICQQSHSSCALLFLDLDHFKYVNDTWGHQAGDALLCEVARRLRNALGPNDFIGRYGGEEFLILLTGADLPAAHLAAEYFRSVVSQPCSWQPDDRSSTISISTTASIGVAIYPQHGVSGKALIESADHAMYRAKANGRNCSSLADLEAPSPRPLVDDEVSMVVRALASVSQVHDQATKDHAQRIADLAEATARRLRQPEEEISLLRLAALFHDIGKIGIPEAILFKPGPLTEEERSIMRYHPLIGRSILEQIGGIFKQVGYIVVAHHERWNGRGYPHGLKKEDIPLSARILAVVDSYDAMISSRPYREEPFTVLQAKTELERCAGSLYDPSVVEALLQVLEKQERPADELGEMSISSPAEIPDHSHLTTDEARQRLEHWRLGIEECHQQQLTLQQRIEALRQRQDYLAWQ